MSDNEVAKLKKDLEDCKNEKSEMDALLKQIQEQLTKTQEMIITVLQRVPTVTVLIWEKGRRNKKGIRRKARSIEKRY